MEQIPLYDRLSQIDVNDHVEQKNGLSYLSWAWAWDTFKKNCPSASYRIQKNPESGLPCFGDVETGWMCYTEITVGEETHEMWLPVMDFRNQSIKKPTTFDINKTMMRCLVKNMMMFGLGAYIYAGEDLPEKPEATPRPPEPKKSEPGNAPVKTAPEAVVQEEPEAVSVRAPEPDLSDNVKLSEVQFNAIIAAFDKLGVEVWDLERQAGDHRSWTMQDRRKLLKTYHQLQLKGSDYSVKDFLAGKELN